MQTRNRKELLESMDLFDDMILDVKDQVYELAETLGLLMHFYEVVTEQAPGSYRLSQSEVDRELSYIQEMKKEWKEMVNERAVSSEDHEQKYES